MSRRVHSSSVSILGTQLADTCYMQMVIKNVQQCFITAVGCPLDFVYCLSRSVSRHVLTSSIMRALIVVFRPRLLILTFFRPSLNFTVILFPPQCIIIANGKPGLQISFFIFGFAALEGSTFHQNFYIHNSGVLCDGRKRSPNFISVLSSRSMTHLALKIVYRSSRC